MQGEPEVEACCLRRNAGIYAAQSPIPFPQQTVRLCFSFIEQTLRLLVPVLVVRVSQHAFQDFV